MADLLVEVLRAAREHGPRPALTDARGRTLTYTELSTKVLSTAQRLRRNGFTPGTRMLFSIRPGPDAIVLALGTVAAGGTVVFVDPGGGPELFARRTDLAGPGWAAAESVLYAASAPGPLRVLARRRGVLLPDYSALPVRHIRSGPWLPGVPWKAVSTRSLAKPVDAPFAEPDLLGPHPDQDAVIVFTSGTTAAPKAVVHTRGSLAAALDALATRCALGPDTRVHTDQMMLGLPALVAGAHWSMPPYGFAPSADPAALAAGLDGATHTFLVPADLAVILDSGVPLPRSLRQVLLGSAPVLPPLLKRARAALPDVELLAVYGMTEILPVAIATAEEKIAHGGDLLGRPLPGVRARVAEDGELLVSGPNLCRGYLGHPPLTEHATGDLARLDGDLIVLTGRKKDMILRGKTNVYPGLHEPAIAGLPGVAAAVMIGVPDEIGDERIVLALVPAPDAGPGLADRVRAALPGLIDASALPDEIAVLPDLPVAGRNRKVDRSALRARLAG